MAQGAAIQAAKCILVDKGSGKNMVTLYDCTFHSLGVKLKDGKFSKIIEKNTRVPDKKEQVYRTVTDNLRSKLRFLFMKGRRKW